MNETQEHFADVANGRDDVPPFTLTEIAEREADYLRAALTLDWRKRRRTRRDIADAAFLRLIATVRMYATGCVGLAAQLLAPASGGDK